MKKNKVKKKSKENELAIMLLMTCMALEENKYELSLSEEDEYTVEFSDPLTDIHGCISLKKDRKCSILMMDETTWVPSKASMKLFAEAYMKNDSNWRNHSEFNSELLMDGGSDHNTLLFYIDIMKLNSKGATIICGNYDGMVLCIKCNYIQGESRWFVDNVFVLHKDWVWKCVSLDSAHFVSCGYDGKLWSVDTNNNTKELLLNKEGEKFYDFCFDTDNNDIWLVSEHKLFLVRKKDSRWKKGIVCELANIEPYYCFRTITIDNASSSEEKTDNMPVLFYNEGKGKQGHIAKVNYDAESKKYRLETDFIDLAAPDFSDNVEENGEKKTNYLFIRHMRFHNFNGRKRLIAVGNIGGAGFILVAKYTGDSEKDAWVLQLAEYPVA